MHGNSRSRQRNAEAHGVAARVPAAFVAAGRGWWLRWGVGLPRSSGPGVCGVEAQEPMRSGTRRPGPGARCLFGGLFMLRARDPRCAGRRRRTARAGAIHTGCPRTPESRAARSGTAGPGDRTPNVRAWGPARGLSAHGRSSNNAGRSVRFGLGLGPTGAAREAPVVLD